MRCSPQLLCSPLWPEWLPCLPPQLKEGAYVWVKDLSIAGSDVFTKGHILNINGNKITVETSNSVKTQELIIPSQDCFHICPEGDVPDHCQLMFLIQPTKLENTRKRFAKDKIYTLVGEILIAVNPFKWIQGMYGDDRPGYVPRRSSAACTVTTVQAMCRDDCPEHVP